MTGNRTIEGEVVQVLYPWDKSDFMIPGDIRALAENRAIVVVWTSAPSPWRRWVAETPVVGTLLGPIADFVEPIEWTNVIVPNDLGVKEGDRIEIEAEPTTVSSVWTTDEYPTAEVRQRAAT